MGVAIYRGPSELHGVETWSFRNATEADRHVGRMVDHVRYRRSWGGADLERGSYRFVLRPDGGIAEFRDRDVGLRSARISYWSVQRVPHEWVMAATALPPILWALRRVRRAAVRRGRARRGLCVNCGYDLRGSPGRCSECGQVTAAEPGRTAGKSDSAVAGPAAVLFNGAQPTGKAD